eukprot:735112-Hanusia_phi.AAC.1
MFNRLFCPPYGGFRQLSGAKSKIKSKDSGKQNMCGPLNYQYDACFKFLNKTSLREAFLKVVEKESDISLLSTQHQDQSAMEVFNQVQIETDSMVHVEMTSDPLVVPYKLFQLERALRLRAFLVGSQSTKLAAIGVIMNGNWTKFKEISTFLQERWLSFGQEHEAQQFLLVKETARIPMFLIFSPRINQYTSINEVKKDVE